MSIATLCARRETSSPPNYKGRSWVVRVNGLIYSKKAIFLKDHPNFEEVNGELVLATQVDLDDDLKEVLDNKPLPINLVTALLKSLAQAGCKVVTSTSGAASDEEIWFIWTLSF